MCPSSREQAAFAIFVNQMRSEGKAHREIILELTGAIHVGISQDIWPTNTTRPWPEETPDSEPRLTTDQPTGNVSASALPEGAPP